MTKIEHRIFSSMYQSHTKDGKW